MSTGKNWTLRAIFFLRRRRREKKELNFFRMWSKICKSKPATNDYFSQKAISWKTVGMTTWQSKSLLSRSVKVFIILDLFFISHCGSLNSQIILYVWFLNLSYLVDFLVRLFQAKFNCKYKICMIWWISLSYVCM